MNRGQRRRDALRILTNDPALSNAEVARRVDLSPTTVAAVRRSGASGSTPEEPRQSSSTVRGSWASRAARYLLRKGASWLGRHLSRWILWR